jgi:hypothetical protein
MYLCYNQRLMNSGVNKIVNRILIDGNGVKVMDLGSTPNISTKTFWGHPWQNVFVGMKWTSTLLLKDYKRG